MVRSLRMEGWIAERLSTNYTSNQIRTDHIYLEGRGYTNLTILVKLLFFKFIIYYPACGAERLALI